MTTEINTTDFGNRLKLAREEKRYTRPSLAKKTNIPVKSLEKYEYGDATPTIERFYKLAEILDVSTQYLLEGDKSQIVDEIEPTHVNEEDENSIEEKCHYIDELREEGFQLSWRSAPRLILEVKNEIESYDVDTLLDLAEVRGLYVISDDEIEELSNNDKEIFEETSERILDTLYFGIDLYAIHKKSLEELAVKLRLKTKIIKKSALNSRRSISEWNNISDVIAAIRPLCREKSLKGKSPDFKDENRFKAREIA